MSGYTKGMWIAVGSMVEHVRDDIADVASCDPAHFGQGHLARTEEECMANARLFAASPKLLTAARLAVRALRKEFHLRNNNIHEVYGEMPEDLAHAYLKLTEAIALTETPK